MNRFSMTDCPMLNSKTGWPASGKLLAPVLLLFFAFSAAAQTVREATEEQPLKPGVEALSPFNGSMKLLFEVLKRGDSPLDGAALSRSPDGLSGLSNPNLIPACPTDVILVLDESASIAGNAAGASNIAPKVRAGAYAFALAFNNTGARMAVVEYSSSAQVAQVGSGTGYRLVTNNYLLDLNKYLYPVKNGQNDADAYDPEDHAGLTNWQAAFNTANTLIANNDPTPPLVVFFTDGEPTLPVNGALDAAMNAADAIKAKGVHIFVVALNNPSVPLANVQTVTDGPNSQSYDSETNNLSRADYVVFGTNNSPTTFEGDLYDAFGDMAGALCTVDVSLTKMINNTTPVIGNVVNFTLTLNNAATANMPASGLTVTDYLPPGFEFQPGSMGFDAQGTGAKIIPVETNAPVLLWTIDQLDAGETVRLTFKAKVLPGSNINGDYINRAEVTELDQVDADSDVRSSFNKDDKDDNLPDDDEAFSEASPVSCDGFFVTAYPLGPGCTGNTKGSITYVMTGGTPKFDILWDGAGSNDGSLNGLESGHKVQGMSVGTYQITVTDSKGCTFTMTVTIAPPPPIVLNTEVISALCSGAATDAINLTVTGGVAPYSYQWSNGATTEDILNLQQGPYCVTVTDYLDCTAVKCDSVVLPLRVVAGVNGIVSCKSPVIQLDGTGSSTGPDFSYQWTTQNGNIVSGANTLQPSINKAGTYVLAVTKLSIGCTGTASVTVGADLSVPLANAGPPRMLTCADTVLQLQGTGSSGPGFTIQWTAGPGNILNGGNTYTPRIDQPGVYVLKVTNQNNGCSEQSSVIIGIDKTPPAADAGPTKQLNCANPTMQLQGTGSTGPGFAVQWTAIPGQILAGAGTYTPTVGKVGNYRLTVTNLANGCFSRDTVNVTGNFAPPQITISQPGTLTCVDTTVALAAGVASQGGALSFIWTTTNGNIVSGDTTTNPIVDRAGIYVFTATNLSSGCTATASATVLKNSTPPFVYAGPNTTLNCKKPQLALNGSVSGGAQISYSWQTSGGHFVSGANTLNPVIDSAGVYTLSVLNNQNGCTAQSSVTVGADFTPPAAQAGPDKQLSCASPTLTLDGTGSTTGPGIAYQWTANPGSILSGATTLNNALVVAAGRYTLVVVNTANGCTASDDAEVTSVISLPAAVVSPAPPLTCITQSVTLNAAGSSQGGNIFYTWSTANGNIVSGQGTLAPQVDKPGIYQLVVTNPDNSCTASASVTVLQNITPPKAVIASPPLLTCVAVQVQLNGIGSSAGSAFSYQWASAGGNILSGATTLSPTVDQPGVYTLTILNAENGCTASASVTVSELIVTPVAVAAPAQNLTCAVKQVMLNGSGSSPGSAYNYVWHTSNGNIVSGINSLFPVVNAPGNYQLIVVHKQSGCTASAQVTVGQDITPPVAAVAPGGALTCTANSVTLNGAGSSAGAGFSYQWNGPAGAVTSGQGTLNPVVASAGVYRLVVTNTLNGCTASASATVTVDIGVPVADAGPHDTLNCFADQLTLDGSASSMGPDFSYAWSGPGIIAAPNTVFPLINAPGLYRLTVTDNSNGCTAVSGTLVLLDRTAPVAEASVTGGLNCAVTTLEIDGSNSSTGPQFSYAWTASGGGNILSGNNTLKPVVNGPGTYTLVVTNTENGCTASDAVTVSQDITPPLANAGAPGLITCTQTSVTLAGNGSSGPEFTIQWLTANGSIVSGANTFNPVVDAPGAYQLVVTNTVNFCTATSTVQVTRDVNVPVASILPPGMLNCVADTVTLDALASSSGPNFMISWTTVNGSFRSGTNTLTPVVDAPGQYMLRIFNAANNCEANFSVNVEQNLTPPQADAGNPAVLSCTFPVLTLDGSASSQGPFFSYQWTTSFTGNLLSGPNTLSPEVDRSGQYTIIVTDNRNGCTATASVLILLDMDSPQAEAGPDMALTCTFDSVTLGAGVANPAYVYQWTAPAGGNIVSGADGTRPVVDAPGMYRLLVINPDNGCTNADSVTVILDVTPPQAVVAPPAQLNCQFREIALETGGSSSGPMFYYTWTTTNGNIRSGAYSAAPVVDQPGDYQLLLLNILNGCTATASVTVSEDVEKPVAAAAQPDQLNCAVKVFALQGSASNAGTNPQYAWKTTGGNILSGAATLNPVIDAPGVYLLTVTNLGNQCTATAEVAVTQDTTLPLAVVDTVAPLTCLVKEVTLFSTGSSAGPLFRYAWTAQNGGNILSGPDTPAPTVDAAGDYLLTVTNTQNQCTATAVAAVAADTLAPAADAGNPVLLDCRAPEKSLDGTASSSGAGFSYLWDTSDGLIVSGENTLTPVIATPGLYTLLVVNTLNGCSQTASVSATQDFNTPKAAIADPELLTCIVAEQMLQGIDSTGGSHHIFQWSTIGGQIVSGANTLSATISAPGDYILLVIDTLNGCAGEAMVSVYQNTDAPQVTAVEPDTLNCVVKEISLTTIAISAGGKSLSYAWSTANGTIVSGANSSEAVVSAGGLYKVTVTDSFNGCTATAEVTAPVDVEQPAAAAAQPGVLTCAVQELTLDGSGSVQGPPFSYAWSGPSIISGSGALEAVVNQPGVYSLVVLNTGNGCSSAVSVEVEQDTLPPLAEAGPAFELNCTVSEVYLNAEGSSSGPGFSFQWSTLDGNMVSDPSAPSLLVDATGVYFLKVTDTRNGCTAVDLTIVSEDTNYPTDLNLFVDPPGCDGKTGTVRVDEVLGGTGPYVFSIDGGETFGTSSQFRQLQPGQYILVVQDANGCEYADTLDFPELPGLNVQLGPDIDVEFGGATTLTAYVDVPHSEIDTVIWSPAEFLTPTNNLFKVIVQPYIDRVFTVTVINRYGCEDRSSIVIRVGDPRLWAPNAFSPNTEDGRNDRFLIFAADNTVKQINTMQVFDRWGNVVFERRGIQPNDAKAGWDGYFRGKLVNSGVFVWWAEVELLDGNKVLMKGDVTVVD